MFTNKKGFTLLELLVVVLIIGILAAVALPQYKKAIVKTHFSELKVLTKNLFDAAQMFYLSNGSHADVMSDLDFDLAGATYQYRGVSFKDSGYYCGFTNDYVSCKNNKLNMAYRMDFTGERACVAYDSDKTNAKHQICKAETKRNGPSEGYSSTYFYP